MTTPGPTLSLRWLTGQVESWVRGRLWLQVVVGLALGLATGLLLSQDAGLVGREDAAAITAWLALPGRLFLGLITLVLVPLVVASIMNGLNEQVSAAVLKRVGFGFGAFVIVTTVCAALIGLGLAHLFEPGGQLRLDPGPGAIPPIDPDAADKIFRKRVPDLVVGLLPTNPTRAVLNQDMMEIVVLAVLIGLAARQARRERVRPFLDLMNALLEISMTVVKWAMFLTPWAVFGLMAQLVATVGAETVLGLAAYVGTVLAGLAILFLLFLVIVAILGRRSPAAFLRDIGPVMLLAFSTSSSAAVMPLSIDTAVRRLRVPEGVANMVIPLGATVNMAGTALYQSVAIIFLAQVAGVSLGPAELAAIVLTLVATSIGAPGTPGISVVILATVAANFGIPAAGLVLVLGVDRILDMCRTAVNVTGDLTAAAVVSRGMHQTPRSPADPTSGTVELASAAAAKPEEPTPAPTPRS